jgi:hypothetical protein
MKRSSENKRERRKEWKKKPKGKTPETIKKNLQKHCVLYVHDSGMKGDRVSWVQCDSVERKSWVHLKCIPKRIMNMIDQGNSFYCPSCQWLCE